MDSGKECQETRDRFFGRLLPLIEPSEIRRIELAYILSKYGHRAQSRKEIVDGHAVRYFEHPRRVALILIDEIKCLDPDLICTCLLHDILEDTAIGLDFIEQFFGQRVARMVAIVSKIPKEGYVERLNVYAEWDDLIIKFCDKLDNMRHLLMEGTSAAFVVKQLNETTETYIPLFQRLQRIGPKKYARAIGVLQAELSKLVTEGLQYIMSHGSELPQKTGRRSAKKMGGLKKRPDEKE